MMLSEKRAIGGEFPLTPSEAERWFSSAVPETAIPSLLERYGGESAIWMGFSRSALAVALDLTGVRPGDLIAVPEYQCVAVIEKIMTRGRLQPYGLTRRLRPLNGASSATGRACQAVVTTVYFGSRSLEAEIGDLACELRSLPNTPWIIEDRVMCFPSPVDPTSLKGRCDFAVLGFRKHYPVPDGALLLACSDRAREALRRAQLRLEGETPSARKVLQAKVQAKATRMRWLDSPYRIDTADANGLAESIASEKLVEALASSSAGDTLAGSRASAAFLLNRSIASDADRVRQRAALLEATLRAGDCDFEMPLSDCWGVGLPLLTPARDSLKARAAERGIYLPVHWPPHRLAEPKSAGRAWHDEELTLPTAVHISDENTRFLAETIVGLRDRHVDY